MEQCSSWTSGCIHSALGEFWLSGDSIAHTYLTRRQSTHLVDVVRQVPPTKKAGLLRPGLHGGYQLCVPVQVHVGGKGRRSINRGRGTDPRIRDRLI